MRIAFIDDEPEVYPSSYGGKARTIRTLASAFAKTASVNEVLIASRSIRDVRKEFYEGGVRFKQLEGYGIASQLRRIVQEYDVVNVHTCSFTFPHIPEASARIAYHLHDVIYATSDAGSHLDKALGGQWSGILAPSEFAAQTLRNVGWWSPNRDLIALSPRIIDAEAFAPIAQRDARKALGELLPGHASKILDSYPLVAFPNRPTAGKGGEMLTELHDVLRTQYDSPVIITTGESGDSHSSINCGWLQTNQLRALYSAADVCLVPSVLPESFSQVPLEAIMCGTPAVCTRFGNLAALVDTVPGVYGTKPSATHIAEAVREALTVGRAETGEGRAMLQQLHNSQNVISGLLEVYDSMSSRLSIATNNYTVDKSSRWFTSPILALYDDEAFVGSAQGSLQRVRFSTMDRAVLKFCTIARTEEELSRSGLDYVGSVRRLHEAGALVEG